MVCAQAVQRNICTPNWANACQPTQVTLLELKASCAAGDLVLHSQAELQALIQQSAQTNEPIPAFDPAAITQIFSTGFGVVVLFFLVGRGIGEVLRLIRFG